MKARLAWAVGALGLAVLLVSTVAGATAPVSEQVAHFAPSDYGWALTRLCFIAVGSVVAARRPEHRIGWLMLIAGVVNAASVFVGEYASWGLQRHPGSLPAASVAAWLTTMTWAPATALIVGVVVYFPTGSLLSPRWRVVPAALLVAVVGITAATGVQFWPPHHAIRLLNDSQLVRNTFAGHVVSALWPVVMLCVIASLVSVVLRYRRARGLERQQLKWIMLAAVLTAPFIVAAELWTHGPFYEAAQVANSPALFGLAAALAVLRYRLYEIDRIVSRTVSYAVVTGVVVGVYVGVIATIDGILGSSSSVAVAASTLVAAAVFQPVRLRVQGAVDRRFDRATYDARRTVETFSLRLRDEVDMDNVRADLLTTVERAMAPATASVWLASS